jgi:RND family efflux transporter MFP subunit
VKRIRVAAIALCLAVAAAGCSKDKDPNTSPEKPPKPVQVGTVGVGTITRVLTVPGSVMPVRDVWVSAEVGGRIIKKHVVEGQRVHVEPNVAADQQTANLIATIDPGDYQRLVNQAQAALQVAEAGLKQSTATQKRLADDIERKRPLHDQKIISDNAWDDLVTNKEETDAQVALYKARIEEAKQALDIATSNLAKTDVRSPLDDGLVADVAFDEGQFVTAGQQLARVVNLDAMWLDMQVGESRLGEVSEGREVTFTVPTYSGETFRGTISSISPAGDPASRSFLVRASVENTDHRLKAGMFAVATIPVNHREGVTVVPKSAVRQEGKFRYVFVVDGTKVARRLVTLGLESGDSVEVVEGIRPGVEIVTVGVETLNDGDRIKPIEAAPAVTALTPAPWADR